MFKTYKPDFNSPDIRKTNDEIKRQSEIFSQNKILIDLIESLSQMLVVLNNERQIIYANKRYHEFCNLPESELILGKRPGEAINCVNAFVSPGGCGDSDFCKTCGAANAILESHRGIQSTKECRILTQTLESKDIIVTTTPFELEGENFTIFALTDIRDKKRREMIERVFFHDILNSAGSISGLSAILKETKDPEEIAQFAEIICRASKHLVEEIQVQRQLSEAERGALHVEFKEVQALTILSDLKDLYSSQVLAADKTIIIDKNAADLTLQTDPVLLRRILGNMVKNAIEVYNPNTIITLNCTLNNHTVQFSVHNDMVIEKSVQLQLFKRSFTTKGTGRGLGTYSMKLLGEKYLNGKVWFESSEKTGTTFFIEI
jgi:signal transduction histidine kinase